MQFNHIPQNQLVPLFYAEMDNSAANIFSQNQRALIIGQKSNSGSATVGEPVIVSAGDASVGLFGQGSMLDRAMKSYRLNDGFGEVWAIPLSDNPAGAAAGGTTTFTGNASSTGTLSLYIAGQLVEVPVGSGDTPSAIATAVVNAVNGNADLPVSATFTGGQVTWAAKWKGLTGNDITISHNFRGQAAGEQLPAGVTVAHVALSGGTADPSLAAAIASMGDNEYDFIIHPYTATSNLDLLQTEMNDSSGRWAWNRMVYGHCYTAKRGTLSDLVTFGGLRNDPHHTIAGIDVDCPNPSWEYAAAYGARNAVYLKASPARPTQTGPLEGIIAPRAGKNFVLSERSSLLNYGIATSSVNSGRVQVERARTTYQKNPYGQRDVSYLDSETMFQSMYVIRRLRNLITSKYGRHCLADDGTSFAEGSAIVTPSVIRGELIDEYRLMEFEGIVENATLFKKYLVVQRNATDPNRLDVLFPPDYVNQLRVFALLNQFRLQYPATA